MNILKKLDRHFEEYFVIGAFSMMIIFVSLQVFFRYVLNSSLIWSEELTRYLFIWQIFFGASLSIRDDSHLKVDIIYMVLPKYTKAIKIISYSLFLAFSIVVFWRGLQLVQSILFVKKQLTPTLGIPMGIVYSILPLGTLLMSIRLVQRIVKTFKGLQEES